MSIADLAQRLGARLVFSQAGWKTPREGTPSAAGAWELWRLSEGSGVLPLGRARAGVPCPQQRELDSVPVQPRGRGGGRGPCAAVDGRGMWQNLDGGR